MRIYQNDHGFKYIRWAHGVHSSRILRVWINQNIEQSDGEIQFPVKGQIVKTEKGGLVLRPDSGTVYLYEVVSGYRGRSKVEMISGGAIMSTICQLRGGRGALGDTTITLINGKNDPVVIRWHRTGRRVDLTTGICNLTPDGKVMELFDDPEIYELLT